MQVQQEYINTLKADQNKLIQKSNISLTYPNIGGVATKLPSPPISVNGWCNWLDFDLFGGICGNHEDQGTKETELWTHPLLRWRVRTLLSKASLRNIDYLINPDWVPSPDLDSLKTKKCFACFTLIYSASIDILPSAWPEICRVSLEARNHTRSLRPKYLHTNSPTHLYKSFWGWIWDL